MSIVSDLECVTEKDRASVLLHPLRLRVLELAREPRSASEIAQALELPRQKVNYHVRELHRAEFLRKAGERRKRNLIEKRFVATARSYLLAPEVLGPVLPRRQAVADEMSAAFLLTLSAELQSDVVRVCEDAAARDQRVATLSMSSDLRFESAEQRAGFADALRDAVARVVAEHASPALNSDGSPGSGRPFRLMLGCWPVPAPASESDA